MRSVCVLEKTKIEKIGDKHRSFTPYFGCLTPLRVLRPPQKGIRNIFLTRLHHYTITVGGAHCNRCNGCNDCNGCNECNGASAEAGRTGRAGSTASTPKIFFLFALCSLQQSVKLFNFFLAYLLTTAFFCCIFVACRGSSAVREVRSERTMKKPRRDISNHLSICML